MADQTTPPHSPTSPLSKAADPTSPASPLSADHRISTKTDTSSQQTQDEPTRLSAYAENRPNPLPQFVDPAEHAPEVVNQDDEPLTSKHEGAGGAAIDPFAGVPVTRPPPGLIEPDVPDPRSPAIVYAEPRRTWCGRNRTWVVAGLLTLLILVLGIVAGVVVGTRREGGGGGGSR